MSAFVRVLHLNMPVWAAEWSYIPRPGERVRLGGGTGTVYEVLRVELVQLTSVVPAEVEVHVVPVT